MVKHDFTGKVALITGGASGIGLATARLFAAAGAKVAIADISDEAGKAAVAQLVEAGGVAEFFAVDVADEDQVRAMVERVVETFGGLDIALNNAGLEGDITPLADLDSKGWRRLIDVNLSSVFYCLKAEIGVMRRRGGGAIVNTASVLGLMGSYMHADYVAAKHGVVGLTRSAALDHAKDGVRVNAVCPGLIDTPFSGEMPLPMRERLLFSVPMSRMGQPEEIAKAIVWLCSQDASYITGTALAVDGGVTVGGTGTRFDDLM